MKTWVVHMALILGMILSCSEEKEGRVLYLAHNLPQTHPVHKGILHLKSSLEEASGGKMTVKIFPDGQLGSEREVLELLQIGSIAVTKVSAATLSNFVPEYHVLGIPYIFRDEDHKFRVLEGEIGLSILEKGSRYLLRGLCYYDAGSRSFFTRTRAIRSPQDLKGMKIRVMNNQMSTNMVNALGGSGTPMAYSELYTAIQQGVVDGAENNAPSFVKSNQYEVCKYYTLDEHSAVPDVLVISSTYWNKLSEEEKKWLKHAARESARLQKIYWRESVEESMRTIREHGIEIIRPDKSLFAERTEVVSRQFLEEFPEMKELVDQIKSQ